METKKVLNRDTTILNREKTILNRDKTILREKNLAATILIILVFIILFVFTYVWISKVMTARSLRRMEEGVNTVIDEVTNKLNRDSLILNTTADILSDADNFDVETVRATITNIMPLLDTMKIRVLLPDNTVVDAYGEILVNDEIFFDIEAPLGEHVSNRVTSIVNGNIYVLRHYVPVVKDGKTVALVYGVTLLEDLPRIMNIDNLYNASARVCILDTETGEFIMDTLHDGNLGNIADYPVRSTREGADWNEKIEELMNRKPGHVLYRAEELQDWYYLYYDSANINQWAIAVAVPEKEALANLHAVQRIYLIFTALTAVVMILYYTLMRRNAIEAMENAARTVALEERLEKAEAAERAKTMFLSNMSHDIRTPMNAIIGFTTLAETNIDNKERVQGYLAKIMSSSNHLLSLINDILDMSRIESGRLNIEEKECSISEIFRDMRNILQTQMQAKQLDFFMDALDVVDEDIFCDKLHLNQVFLNLLGNSIKFTPAGGSVSMIIKQNPCEREGFGAYEIRVKDTGIGMSEEFAQHVFEAFEREKTSTVSGIQGTGLGMAITKSIVEAMGGTIRVETQQGKGTEFIINLEFRLQTEHKEVEVVPELEGLRALVVDDNFNTCDSVTKMLTQIGMRVEWTMRGKEAVLYARQGKEMQDEFDVYIIDWALPDLGGIEVVRQVCGLVGDNVPIMMLTAYDWAVIEEEAKSVGVNVFCNKPIFISELRDALIKAINRTDTASAESILPAADVDLKGKRLLLVEDNELNREIATELLQESGFLVESAEDGTIGVEMVKNSEPGYYDLILMDVQMPIMNGYDASRAIRALEDPVLSSIPIVAMTANAFNEDKEKAMESGMNAHVAKPIDVMKLMEVLQSMLK